MKIQNKLNLGFLVVSMFVIFVGGISVWANHRTINELRLKQEHFRSMVNTADTATVISSHAKSAEAHLMLFLTLHDTNDRNIFFDCVKALENQISILHKNVPHPEIQQVIKVIKTEEQQFLSRAKALLSTYDQEKAATGSFSLEKHRELVLSFHDSASALRSYSVQFANYSTNFLNRQAAIKAATEVSSYTKRAEGHLMLFLTLHDIIDRDKFFKRITALNEQIKILQEHVLDPEGRQIIGTIATGKDKLLSQGKVLLVSYDQEKSATGSFSLEKHRDAVLSLHDIASDLHQLGIKAKKHNIDFATQTRQEIIQSARYFQFVSYVSIICAIVLSLVLGYWISKKLTYPLKQLQYGLTEIGKGRLNTVIDIKSRDETRTLAETFNNMASDLIKLKSEIEKRNRKLKQEIEERKLVQAELQKVLDEIKTLRGIIPICTHCKKIRDDKGVWNKLEKYIHEHSYAEFSHGVCPKCAEKFYSQYSLYDNEGNT